MNNYSCYSLVFLKMELDDCYILSSSIKPLNLLQTAD